MVAYHLVSSSLHYWHGRMQLGRRWGARHDLRTWKVHKFTSSCDLRLRACSNGGTSWRQQDGRISFYNPLQVVYVSFYSAAADSNSGGVPPRGRQLALKKIRPVLCKIGTRRFFSHPPLFPPLLLRRAFLSITIRGFSSRGHCAVIRGGSHQLLSSRRSSGRGSHEGVY